MMFHLTPTSLFSNFCGVEDHGAVVQRAELVAGGRQIGDHVGVVERQVLHRLHDHGSLRRELGVDPAAIRFVFWSSASTSKRSMRTPPINCRHFVISTVSRA